MDNVYDIIERIEAASLRAEEIGKNIIKILREMENIDNTLLEDARGLDHASLRTNS